MKLYFSCFLMALTLFTGKAHSQSQSTDSVFVKETFGTGTVKTVLPAGRTTYSFNCTTSLADGDYFLLNRTNGRPEWHNTSDHTGNTDGRAMVINASYTPSEFYRDTVMGLMANTNYAVYLYIMNINTQGTCGASAILPRLQFIVESYNTVSGTFSQLATFTTALIPQSASPVWVVAGGSFFLPNGVTNIRYRILNNSNGGCGNDLAIDDITFARAARIPLPVTGLQVSAARQGNNVIVNWHTISESNTKSFVVEKSQNGYDWNDLTEVAAAGYSQTRKEYSAPDPSPASVNFYRIRQVDIDGHFTYSNICRLNAAATTIETRALPNPFNDQLQAEINTNEDKMVTITLSDASGRTCIRQSASVKKGRNSIVMNNAGKLVPGIYFMGIAGEDGSFLYRTKVVKN